ncbi:A-kinase anchor protein 1, mitochondrial, partial [Nannospalax galili]|uniref:A-kinase anchor protein 1, mitochondrial n=1 Tax=Nannospalax galili TaxID=1026970 RepID=UPI00111BDAB9
MAIQFRSLFPLALPGMLALLGWWWFFSRKKERLNSNDKQAKALMASPAIKDPIPKEEACPGVVSFPSSVTQLPEKEELSVGKPSTEPPALPWMRQVCHRSESSGSLSIITDTGLQPGPCRDDSTKVELSLMGDEAKCIPLECPLPPKDVPSPHEAVEMYKQESALGKMPRGRWPGQSAVPGEKARETGGAEGTGDAVLGENVPEEALLSLENVSEVEKNKAPSSAPVGGGGETGNTGPSQVAKPAKKEEYDAGKLPSGFVEVVHPELVKDEDTLVPQVRGSDAWVRDPARELGKEETLPENEQIEQAAFQIISQVILEATEEVLATTMGKSAAQVHPTSGIQPQGQEKSCVPASQKIVLGQDTTELASSTAGPDASLPEALPPKTYISCFSSPLSSPTKDEKPKNSAYPISLAPCLPPATSARESLEGASVLGNDSFVTCISDTSQNVPSVASSGQCSDSVSTSGLEDSCIETISIPRDKAITPPLPDSTGPFSNGVLKEELSDLGAEDGWTVDAEADHSGGRK